VGLLGRGIWMGKGGRGGGIGWEWGRSIPYLPGLQPRLHGHEVYKYTEDGGARGDHYY